MYVCVYVRMSVGTAPLPLEMASKCPANAVLNAYHSGELVIVCDGTYEAEFKYDESVSVHDTAPPTDASAPTVVSLFTVMSKAVEQQWAAWFRRVFVVKKQGKTLNVKCLAPGDWYIYCPQDLTTVWACKVLQNPIRMGIFTMHQR